MKTPDDIHISQNELIYSDVSLPRDAVFFGFTIDDDNNEANEQIRKRLAMLRKKDADWRDIVLDGKQNKGTVSSSSNDRRYESPFAPFVSSFDQLLKLLGSKINRMRLLARCYEEGNCDFLDWFVYRESIIVQIAGMCVAGERDNKKNYTIQSFLYRQGVEASCSEVERILNQNLCADGNGDAITVRTALRIVRDKFICHLDNLEAYDLYGNVNVHQGSWTRADMLVILEALLPYGLNERCAVIQLINAMNNVYVAVVHEKRYEMLFKNLRDMAGREE